MSTRRPPSIMVAIRSIDRASAPLLRKAAELALKFNASLRLVHVIPLAMGQGHHRPAPVGEALTAEINACALGLRDLYRRVIKPEIACVVDVVCGYPPADAIAQLARKYRPLFVLAASHTHNRFARLWLSNTDWELLRRCACPVWLSKQSHVRSERVLAAVDPFHEHAKPAGLDDLIVEQAIKLAGSASRVDLVHCYSPPQTIMVNAGVDAYWVPMPEADRKRVARHLQRGLHKLAERHSIPSANIIVREADVSFELPLIARSAHADIVVMGAVSRSTLQKIFIGNTAERVLDRFNCDVFVVKPRGFKTRSVVSRSPRAQDRSRGSARPYSTELRV